MSEYKFKITYLTHTLETDDIEIIRELCGLSKSEKVEVNTPNESIDPEWNKFLDEMYKKAKQKQPVSPYSSPLNPLESPWVSPYITPFSPSDDWRQTYPQDYTKIQDPLFPQTTIIC